MTYNKFIYITVHDLVILIWHKNVAVSAKSWRCYVCDSTQLKPLALYCSSVLAFVESLQDKGNVKVASVKQKRGRHAKADSSDSSSSASDVSPSVFCGNNIKEVVKLLKSATEPLHQLIAKAEEELSEDSQSADSSVCRQKHEMLASSLKTQYAKCVRALSAVKQTKLQSKSKNCVDEPCLPIVSVERLGQLSVDQTDLSETDCINSSSRASRADIEAQRDLHKQMLTKDESSESSNTDSESSTSSSEDEEGSSSSESDDDDEYDPKTEIRQVKLERVHERRTSAKKQKMRAGNWRLLCLGEVT